MNARYIRSGCGRATWLVLALLLPLLAIAFTVEGGQPAHSHDDGQPGLYNAECPLAEVSAIHAVGQLPDPHGIASFTVLGGPIVSVSFGWVPSPSFRVTEPRAPPLL
jgi:hypothetical protein